MVATGIQRREPSECGKQFWRYLDGDGTDEDCPYSYMLKMLTISTILHSMNSIRCYFTNPPVLTLAVSSIQKSFKRGALMIDMNIVVQEVAHYLCRSA